MKTSQLLKILPGEDKNDFIKDYYVQVKDGLKESNTIAWKFCFYSILIVLLYYAFDAELIKKISLGRILIEDIKLVQIATPLIFIFCYYQLALNLARYNELRVQYDALLFYFTGDCSLREKYRLKHSSILPMNQLDVLLDYFLATNKVWKIFIGIIALVPVIAIFGFALYFIIVTLFELPFKQLPLVSYGVFSVSGFLFIMTLKITGTSNKRVEQDREMLKEFIEKKIC